MGWWQWRRPGAEFGGMENFVGGPKISEWRLFGKKFHFRGKNFWWPFLVIDPIFSDFPFLFPDFPYLCYVKCHIWPFPHKKNTFFTMFVLSRASDNTTSLNIGGPMHGPSPHLKFWGDRPPVPPRSPPLVDGFINVFAGASPELICWSAAVARRSF